MLPTASPWTYFPPTAYWLSLPGVPWVPQIQPLQTHCLPLLEFPAPLPHQPPTLWPCSPGFFLLTRSSASTVLTKQTKGPAPPHPKSLQRPIYRSKKHLREQTSNVPWELTTDLTMSPLGSLSSHWQNPTITPNEFSEGRQCLITYCHLWISTSSEERSSFLSLGAKAVCLSHVMPLECQVSR